MKRLGLAVAIVLVGTACVPAAAQAAFGLHGFDVTFTDSGDSPATQAGSHPFAMTTSFAANLEGENVSGGSLRDLVIEQVPGLVASTTASPSCANADFTVSSCPTSAAVGIIAASAGEPGAWRASPVFKLAPPSGVPLELGFTVFGEHVVIDFGLEPDPPFDLVASTQDIPEAIEVLAVKFQLWGVPADPAHDPLRGACLSDEGTVGPGGEFEFESAGSCSVSVLERPLLTLPTSCEGPQATAYDALSWEGASASGSVLTHDELGDPQGFTGCGALAFDPSVAAKPTTSAAQSPTGLDVSLRFDDEGLTNPTGISQSRVGAVAVALPEGMTFNPAAAKALVVCSEADLAEESLQASSGEGCPDASRVGTVEVESPLLGEPLEGSVFFAGYSTLYVVVKSPKLGLLVEQTVEIESEPGTGQLFAFAEDIPLTAAFSDLRLHLDEGEDSLLLSPPMCGGYQTLTELIPWAGPFAVLTSSSFQIVTGPEGGPCPSGGSASPAPGTRPSAAGGAPTAPARKRIKPARRHCPKGKHKVHRNGKTRCVKKHRAKSK
jgi:hypothetical protein